MPPLRDKRKPVAGGFGFRFPCTAGARLNARTGIFGRVCRNGSRPHRTRHATPTSRLPRGAWGGSFQGLPRSDQRYTLVANVVSTGSRFLER
jgi:hypothetical protein